MPKSPIVYVVDDEMELALALASLVQSIGIDARAYSSGKAFLEAYTAGAPGCLVTDLRMPGMSGDQLQQALLDRGDPLPVIVISGYADLATIGHIMKAGARELFEKGEQLDILIASVQRAVAADAQRWFERETKAARTASTGDVSRRPRMAQTRSARKDLS